MPIISRFLPVFNSFVRANSPWKDVRTTASTKRYPCERAHSVVLFFESPSDAGSFVDYFFLSKRGMLELDKPGQFQSPSQDAIGTHRCNSMEKSRMRLSAKTICASLRQGTEFVGTHWHNFVVKRQPLSYLKKDSTRQEHTAAIAVFTSHKEEYVVHTASCIEHLKLSE